MFLSGVRFLRLFSDPPGSLASMTSTPDISVNLNLYPISPYGFTAAPHPEWAVDNGTSSQLVGLKKRPHYGLVEPDTLSLGI